MFEVLRQGASKIPEVKLEMSKIAQLLTSEYGSVDFLHGLLNKMYYLERNAMQVNE